MRILVFAESYSLNTLTFIRREVQSLLVSEKVKIKVVSLDSQDNNIFNEAVEIINKIATPLDHLKWRLYKSDIYLSRYNKVIARTLTDIVEKFKPDIIHCHFGWASILVFDNLLQGYLGKIKLLIHFHGYDASQLMKSSSVYRDRIRRILSRETSYCIFVSNEMRREVEQYIGFRPKSFLLYYGIDTNKFNRITWDSTKSNFLQVGSLREKKGHIYLLKAFKKFLNKVSEPNKYQLTLVGEGPLYSNLEKAVIDLGISNFVHFAGPKTQEEIIYYLNEASFFVHHSIEGQNGDKEGIPNAIIEAMSVGLPIVSTFHAGIPELVENGINGILIEEKNIEALTSALIEISSWDYSQLNRNRIKKFFSSEIHDIQLLDIYKLLKE